MEVMLNKSILKMTNFLYKFRVVILFKKIQFCDFNNILSETKKGYNIRAFLQYLSKGELNFFQCSSFCLGDPNCRENNSKRGYHSVD